MVAWDGCDTDRPRHVPRWVLCGRQGVVGWNVVFGMWCLECCVWNVVFGMLCGVLCPMRFGRPCVQCCVLCCVLYCFQCGVSMRCFYAACTSLTDLVLPFFFGVRHIHPLSPPLLRLQFFPTCCGGRGTNKKSRLNTGRSSTTRTDCWCTRTGPTFVFPARC